MDKNEVARILAQIASFLELKGENTFRVRAYEAASRAVASYQGSLKDALEAGELAELKGIGPATLDIISEVIETGRSSVLDRLQSEVPHGLVDMLHISGLGVSKIRQIHESLRIETLSELEEAARDGRLADLPRFGKKTADKILKNLTFLRQSRTARLFHNARNEAEALCRVLSGMPEVQRVEIAGSIRRRREVIRDLDFVAVTDGPPDALIKRLGSIPGVTEFVNQTDHKLMLKLGQDTVADIFLSDPARFGFNLVRATGSDGHLELLQRRAAGLGLTWTDEGIWKDGDHIPTGEETDVYRTLQLDFIPPELREGTDEVRAAETRSLPHLVTISDIRGFIHCHSNYSDGTSSIADWAAAAREHGYEYLGITDHSVMAAYAGGLREEDITRQHEEIDDTNALYPDITVLKGVELDILQDGQLDYTAGVRAAFDFVIASVHTHLDIDRAAMTRRILRAMEDPTMVILGHPTGRLLLSRDPYPLDLDTIFEAAAERGVAIEINADPQRLDLDWRNIQRAVAAGVMISIGADAHNTSGMSNMEIGVGIARKGWLTSGQILNTRCLEDFMQFVRRRNGRR